MKISATANTKMRTLINILTHKVALLGFTILTLTAILTSSHGLAIPFDTKLPSLEDSVVLNSGWEYRLGDSPQRQGTAPEWTLSEQAQGWIRTATLQNFQFPKGQNTMWLRVRLPEGTRAGPTLFVENSSSVFQIYMNEKLLYPTTSFENESRWARSVLRWHIIPLLAETSGRYVYVRVSRPTSSESLGRISFGSHHIHYRTIVASSLWRMSFGLISLFIALAGLLIVSFRKNQHLALAFSAMSASAGVFMFLSAPLCTEWMSAPFFWAFLEYSALFVTPVAIYWFWKIFFKTPFSEHFTLCQRIHIAFAISAQIAALSGYISYTRIIPIFFVCTLACIAYLAKMFGSEYKTFPTEIRFPTSVIGVTMLAAMWDMASLNMQSRAISVWPSPFVLALSFVIYSTAFAILRSAIHNEQRLEKTSQLMQRLISAVQDVSSSNQLVTAMSNAAKAMISELHTRESSNVYVYLHQNKQTEESSAFLQAMLVAKGRLVSHPTLGPLKQKFEAMAEQMNSTEFYDIHKNGTLIIPVTLNEIRWGFFTVDNYIPSEVHSDDISLLNTITKTFANTVSAINDRDNSIAEAKRANEIQITSTLQKFLIPESLQIPNSQVVCKYRAASSTGGDWFGYLTHANKNRVDIIMGDATSHGVKSALMVAQASGAVYSALTRFVDDNSNPTEEERLVRLARAVNKVIFDAGREELYMAMLFISIDLEQGKVLYLNAGHPPFYYIDAQSGNVRTIVPKPSQSLGFGKSPNFNVESTNLKPGDILFLSSSGLLDNEGEGGRRVSSRRLKTILEKSRDPQEIQDLITQTAESVWKDAELSDDVTTIAFKWLGSPRSTQQDPETLLSRENKATV